MKLRDFLEELNQGAEKACGDHAQKMFDSFVYTKQPPELELLVNMARLENGSYDEVVAHLERQLELNALEESDDSPIATMKSSTSKPKTPLSNRQTADIVCNYCKEKGHMVKDYEKLTTKRRKMPNKANRLRGKSNLSMEPVARRIMAQMRIPTLKVLGLKTHPISIQTQNTETPI